MHLSSFTQRSALVALLIAAVAVAGWLLLRTPDAALEFAHPITAEPEPPKPAGPPWLYGRADARFTVIGYADLECSYCRAYFPVLRHWIDAHPDVNWQWHHLPLSIHEPSATAEARLAECAGETGGHAVFWQAAAWLYEHTRGDGQGLPEGLRYPDLTPALQACLDSERPDAVIRAQAAEATQQGIAATPTLNLRDRDSGKTLLLHGPVEGDALLSAIDLLAAGSRTDAEPSDSPDMPAGVAGDMPR
ncbi:MAG: disulfide bond formation protein DsbA [Nevskiales bacterium]|nr:disulfide bond formation protein DsbA [Nevskiales bacterium]